ncbi:hypothetical protein JWG43_16155 [Desulfobulbus alkaliphilus]|nr:hypothetical protein [Desulfobulbus alkaliphilus]
MEKLTFRKVLIVATFIILDAVAILLIVFLTFTVIREKIKVTNKKRFDSGDKTLGSATSNDSAKQKVRSKFQHPFRVCSQ